jgi:hypothetical protein
MFSFWAMWVWEGHMDLAFTALLDMVMLMLNFMWTLRWVMFDNPVNRFIVALLVRTLQFGRLSILALSNIGVGCWCGCNEAREENWQSHQGGGDDGEHFSCAVMCLAVVDDVRSLLQVVRCVFAMSVREMHLLKWIEMKMRSSSGWQVLYLKMLAGLEAHCADS